jgi:hypothetical protein
MSSTEALLGFSKSNSTSAYIYGRDILPVILYLIFGYASHVWYINPMMMDMAIDLV